MTREADFCNSNNIAIIDRNNPTLPLDFLEAPQTRCRRR